MKRFLNKTKLAPRALPLAFLTMISKVDTVSWMCGPLNPQLSVLPVVGPAYVAPSAPGAFGARGAVPYPYP